MKANRKNIILKTTGILFGLLVAIFSFNMQVQAKEDLHNPIHHCIHMKDNDKNIFQEYKKDYTDWSYVYFGYYPQTEITNPALIAKIESLGIIQHQEKEIDEAVIDIKLDGVQYRRVDSEDKRIYYADSNQSRFRYYRWEKIKWRVLSVDNDKLFLMADQALFCDTLCWHNSNYSTSEGYYIPYNPNVRWNRSTLRSVLNSYSSSYNDQYLDCSTNEYYSPLNRGGFLQSAFNAAEQKDILSVFKSDFDEFESSGLREEDYKADKIFLLTSFDLRNEDLGFCDYSSYTGTRAMYSTDYAAIGQGTNRSVYWTALYSNSGDGIMVDWDGSFENAANFGDCVVPVMYINADSANYTTIPDVYSEDSLAEYYKTTQKRLFRVFEDGNKSFKFPAGFEVNVGGISFTSGKETALGSDDIAVRIPTDYHGNITISKDGFHTCEIPVDYIGQSNFIGMTKDTHDGFYTQYVMIKDASIPGSGYRNVLGDSFTLYSKTLEEQTNVNKRNKKELLIYPCINWNGYKEGSVWLEQGNIIVPLNDKKLNSIYWEDYNFVNGEPVYICSKSLGGVYTKQKTQIHIYEKNSPNLKFNFGDFDIDPSLSPNVSDLEFTTKLKLDLKDLSDGTIPFNCEIASDGTVKAVLGLRVGKGSETVAAFGDVKEAFKKCENALSSANLSEKQRAEKRAECFKSLMEKHKYIKRSNAKIGVKGEVSVLGYLEGKIEEDDQGEMILVFNEGQFLIQGDASTEYTNQTWIAEAGIPGYVKLKLSGQIQWIAKTKYKDGQFDADSSGEYLKTELGLSAEKGLGLEGVANAGIKGSGKINIENKLPARNNDTVAKASADVKLTGTIGYVSGEWEIYETPEVVFWDGGFCWKDADELDSQKLATEYVFEPDLLTPEMTIGEGNVCVSGLSGYEKPTVVDLDENTVLAAWVAPVPDRNKVDANGVYYAVCKNGRWREPVLCFDDGTADSTPVLYRDNSKIYLSWSNCGIVYGQDSLDDYASMKDHEQFLVSEYDSSNGAFLTPETVSENSCNIKTELPADFPENAPLSSTDRIVLSKDDSTYVLYTACDENDVVQVMAYKKKDDTWSNPIQLTHFDKSVNQYDAIISGNQLNLICIIGTNHEADLVIDTLPLDKACDIRLDYVDYDSYSLNPGQDLVLTLMLTNTGLTQENAMNVTIAYQGENLINQDVNVNLMPGESGSVQVKCKLPDDLSANKLNVQVQVANKTEKITDDNSMVCDLHLTDYSLENADAYQIGEETILAAQVVNRGIQSIPEGNSLLIKKDNADGELLKTVSIPAIAAGEMEQIEISLAGLSAEDKLYLYIAPSVDENLLGNNDAYILVKTTDYLEDEVIVGQEETISPSPSQKPNEEEVSPSVSPSTLPSEKPSISPSTSTSGNPSVVPSTSSDVKPSASPSNRPSAAPTSATSIIPSTSASIVPSEIPAESPSIRPSIPPSTQPSSPQPSVAPTANTLLKAGESITQGTYVYKVTSNSKDNLTVTCTAGFVSTKVVIPDVVNYQGATYKVTEIANGAFKDDNYTSVVIGKNVVKIGKKAFADCSKLKKVTISKSVKEIGSKAFYNCKNLKTVTIKSKQLKKVGSSAFKKIKKGAVIKVPKGKQKAYQKLLKRKYDASTKIK